MKKLLCALLCLLLAFSFTACSDGETDGNESEVEYEYVRVDGSGKYRILELAKKDLRTDIDFQIVDQNGKVCLNQKDIKQVLISFRDGKNRYLELRLTEQGAQNLKDVFDKNKDTVLTMKAGEKELLSPILQDEAEEDSAVAFGEYESLMRVFNAIT